MLTSESDPRTRSVQSGMNVEESAGELWAYVGEVRPAIERALAAHLPCAPAHVDPRFNDALRYALFPGGKRLRPVLTLLGAELVGACVRERLLCAATAVEYVHTSSLIFDDLPCMDDASERRGRASLHRRYGEGLSVLVALALLNASYGLVFEGDGAADERSVRAHAEIVACVGTQGMVTGQTLDLFKDTRRQARNGNGSNGHGGGLKSNSRTTKPGGNGSNGHGRADGVSVGVLHGSGAGSDGGALVASRPDAFDAVRNLKTTALIRLALRLGAILSGARERQLEALSRFAELLGHAYQISDDLLDLAEDAAQATSGLRPPTLAFERGAPDARLRVASLVSQAKGVLRAEFGPTTPARLLGVVADYISERKS
ncbi:MAG TPA: polyprenyl synthetase family protein [Pyrinomonadaceae bacterium]|nr:polyprenyl synthetase family protein [Pyrinomonadaceae bacterium]